MSTEGFRGLKDRDGYRYRNDARVIPGTGTLLYPYRVIYEQFYREYIPFGLQSDLGFCYVMYAPAGFFTDRTLEPVTIMGITASYQIRHYNDGSGRSYPIQFRLRNQQLSRWLSTEVRAQFINNEQITNRNFGLPSYQPGLTVEVESGGNPQYQSYDSGVLTTPGKITNPLLRPFNWDWDPMNRELQVYRVSGASTLLGIMQVQQRGANSIPPAGVVTDNLLTTMPINAITENPHNWFPSLTEVENAPAGTTWWNGIFSYYSPALYDPTALPAVITPP